MTFSGKTVIVKAYHAAFLLTGLKNRLRTKMIMLRYSGVLQQTLILWLTAIEFRGQNTGKPGRWKHERGDLYFNLISWLNFLQKDGWGISFFSREVIIFIESGSSQRSANIYKMSLKIDAKKILLATKKILLMIPYFVDPWLSCFLQLSCGNLIAFLSIWSPRILPICISILLQVMWTLLMTNLETWALWNFSRLLTLFGCKCA